MRTFIYLFITLLLFTGLFTGCKQEETLLEDSSGQTYRPELMSYRSQESIQLSWRWFDLGGLPTSPQRVAPGGFMVRMAEDTPANFVVIADISASSTTYTVEGLENGKTYYFRIEAYNQEAQSAFSNLVVAIPGKPENPIDLFPISSLHRTIGTWSPDGKKIAYMAFQDSSSTNRSPGAGIYVYDLDLANETFAISGTGPDWNPLRDLLALETDLSGNRTIQRRNTHVGTYDLKDTSLTLISGGASYNQSPDWSPDGESLVFLSDREQADNYQIWVLGLNQASSSPNQLPVDLTKLNQLPAGGSRSPGHPTWTPDGNHITFDRFEPKENIFARDIFSVSVGGNVETPVVVSQWNDFSPAWSPDGQKLAFISDRSGMAAIWVKNIQTGAFSQLTGRFDTRIQIEHGKLEWAPDGTKILFTGVHPDNISSLFLVDTH